jgi:hypothetical protein
MGPVLGRALLPLAAVALVGSAPALLAPVATAARQPSALVPQLPRPPLPPDLAALAGKMEAVRSISERFRLRTGISSAGARLPREAESFLRIFDFDISGEVVNAPPAASFTITLLGHTLRIRVVHADVYLYEPAITKRDGGRPWVNLGRHGLSGLLTGLSSPGLPAGSGSASFKSLVTTLRGARSVTELGPGTVDGQAITGFRAMLAPSALEEPPKPEGPRNILSGILSRAHRAPATTGAPPSAALEVFIAPSGLPVRTRISATGEGVTVTALLDIFAINFPLTVKPPPKAQTIDLATARKLSRMQHNRSSAGGERERDALQSR